MSVPQENMQVNVRHSRLGIVSVIIGAALPVLLAAFFISIAILQAQKIKSIGNIVAVGGVLFSVAAPLLHLVGAGLGIWGSFTKNTKKVFPVVGTILNILLGISGVLLWILVISNLKFGFH